jgi:hypothetical protein
MGQSLTIPKRFHVSLSRHLDIANDKYTVKRTSGLEDPDWKISCSSGLEPNVHGPSASKYPVKNQELWRIFMDNGKPSEEYMCGWRRIETIHPTRLDGDEEAIKLWRQTLIGILDTLEVERLKLDKTATFPSIET